MRNHRKGGKRQPLWCSHAIKPRCRISRTENSYWRMSRSQAAWVLLHCWLNGRQHSADEGWSTARLQVSEKQLQGNGVHKWVCLPCSEPSLRLPLTYTHGHRCSRLPCFGVSVQDTHSPACRRRLLPQAHADGFTGMMLLQPCSPRCQHGGAAHTELQCAVAASCCLLLLPSSGSTRFSSTANNRPIYISYTYREESLALLERMS